MFRTTIARRIGYSLFFLFSFLIGLYLTFPWHAVKDKIFALASSQTGTKMTARHLEPSWLTGVEIEGLEIGDKDPIVLDRVRARAHVLAFLTGKQGFTVWLPIGKGEIDADIVMSPELVDIDAKVSKVHLDQVPQILAATGLPLLGIVDVDADLVLGRKDPKRSQGKITLATSGFVVEKGGKVGMFTIPEDVTLGDVKLEVPVTDGRVELKNQRLTGTDIEISLDGAIQLHEVPGRSMLNMMVGLRPTEKLLSSNAMLRPLLKNPQFENVKDSEGFYGLALSGTLQFPKTTPRRK